MLSSSLEAGRRSSKPCSLPFCWMSLQRIRGKIGSPTSCCLNFGSRLMWVDRARVFFRQAAAGLISTVVGIPFAWYLMKKNMLVTLWISIGFVTFGASLCLFLPETLERTKVPDFTPDTAADEEREQAEDRPSSSHQKSIKRKLAKLFDKVQGSHFIFASPMLFGLSIVFLLQALSGHVVDLIIQLASERFRWGLGDVS